MYYHLSLQLLEQRTANVRLQNVILINSLMTWWPSLMKLHQETGRSSWSCSLSLLYYTAGTLIWLTASPKSSNKTLNTLFEQSTLLRKARAGQAAMATSAQGKSFQLSKIRWCCSPNSYCQHQPETTSATTVLHFCAAMATMYILPTQHTKQSPLLSVLLIWISFSFFFNVFLENIKSGKFISTKILNHSNQASFWFVVSLI